MNVNGISQVLEDRAVRGRREASGWLSMTAILCLGTYPAQAQVAEAQGGTPAPAQAPDPSPTLPSAPEVEPDARTNAATEVDRRADTPANRDIIVTGSRVVRDGFKSPTPLSVIGSVQLATNANSNVAQYVTTLPAFTGSSSPRSSTTTGSSGAPGINSLNLRSLGANRTLVRTSIPRMIRPIRSWPGLDPARESET